MRNIPRITLAQKPTPIDILNNFPHPSTIYVKRDDLTGLITSGNKVRKLEYALADAGQQKADTIITCGGTQSNHCRTTAACCRMLGLSPYLVLRGEPVKPLDGNLLIDYLLGSEIRYITHKEYEKVDELMESIARDLREKGRKPYVIPEGASNEIGLMGYAECMAEMKSFIEENKIEAVYAPVGSGGTYAGLLLGKLLYNIKADLLGVIICDTIEYFMDKVSKISRKAIDRYNLKITLKQSDIKLIDGYIGKGYAIPYEAEIKTIEKVARWGVILDVVYGGKTFVGMLNESKNYKKILFVHTGGIFSIFPYKGNFFSDSIVGNKSSQQLPDYSKIL